jgi:2-keto-4-pentenoate hydratase/2-oxohepta-3-ene-1,7-dioic acid hydratase in catechol pathway
LVTVDEVPDPQALGIRCRVNDELRQSSSTGQMVFGVAELIAYASRTITLEPGDLLVTGTPSGVGMAADPPRFLRPGDRMRVEIDGLGQLDNTVRARP